MKDEIKGLLGKLLVPAMVVVILAAAILLSHGHLEQATATTEPAPLYTCVTIRDRKVCNIEAYVGPESHEGDWVGRFAACAPKQPVATQDLIYDGYTSRVIVWCGK